MRKSRLSRDKQGRLVEYFVFGATARTAAALVRVNKSTAAYYFIAYANSFIRLFKMKCRSRGKSKSMKVISAVDAKASADEEQEHFKPVGTATILAIFVVVLLVLWGSVYLILISRGMTT